ncbi:hypothetical protein KC359_g170 [Hortaea werneckii]|nr:hypothetical protein KC359_g170 [Hortaea werneckii]
MSQSPDDVIIRIIIPRRLRWRKHGTKSNWRWRQLVRGRRDKRVLQIDNLIEGLRSWVKSNSKLLLHYAEQASVEWRISALQDQEDADNFDSNVFNTLCKAA